MGGRAVICAACQSANEDDALFCEHCGQPLEQCCPACSTPAKAQARFCRKCGQSLRQPADSGQPVRPPPPSSAHMAALDGLAATFPHHKHVSPDIKHHRIPAPDISFTRPNLPVLLQEIEALTPA
jgi:predicted amidophosphoribosyltransferase